MKTDIHEKKAIYKLLAFALLALLPLLMFAHGCGWFGNDEGQEETPDQSIVEQPSDASPPTPAPAPAPSPDVPALNVQPPEPEPEPEKPQIEAWPVWMHIPAIGVDAEIQDAGTDYEADSMEILPSAHIITWWRESAIPGNDGNALFGGHNRWRREIGQLFELDKLEVGDEMEILYADGTSLNFRLESVFVYLLATAPAEAIMDVEGDARVTIITCKDPFNPSTGTSDNRIIATFKPEEGFEIPDPPIEPFPLKED